MSRQNVLRFFQACVDDASLPRRLSSKPLPEVMLHARVMGFDFTQAELTGVTGDMETLVITERLGEEVNASSSLWPRMWGKPRLQYVIDELYRPLSDGERARLGG